MEEFFKLFPLGIDLQPHFTAYKRNWGQGNVLRLSVCSPGEGGLPTCGLSTLKPRRTRKVRGTHSTGMLPCQDKLLPCLKGFNNMFYSLEVKLLSRSPSLGVNGPRAFINLFTTG